MKILLISIGTRGDMEPFLALGEILRAKGHQVICAFPEQFRDLAEASSLEFTSLGTKFVEMLGSDDGKAALGGGGSGFEKMMANIRLARNQNEINKELVFKQYALMDSQAPDRVVYNGKAIYPLIWGIDNPGKAVLLSPVPYVHAVKDRPHVAFNGNFGPVVNRLTYSLVDFGIVTTVGITLKWLGASNKITKKQIRNALGLRKLIYTISPSLYLRLDNWPDEVQVLGYHERNKRVDWHPDGALTNFLESHKDKRILFVTFGSMTNPEPEAKTKVILDVLTRSQIPAVINTASGGLVRPEQYDAELLHFVSRIPYDWIFPKVHAVIHHGGSGTTHLAFKYGCAAMLIPHIIDQFVWNQVVHDMGAGPKGISIGKISTENLEPIILELVNKDSFKAKAAQIANQMGKEDFREEIYQAVIEG